MPLFDAKDDRRFRFWNTAPADPTLRGSQHGFGYRNARRAALMPDDAFPLPIWPGRTLRSIPSAWLAWVESQAWSRTWPDWEPVRDYLTRYPLPGITTMPAVEFFVDALRPCVPTPRWKFSAAAHLHCRPGNDLVERCLHAFALGALRLRRNWYQEGAAHAMPHYDLSPGKHAEALRSPLVHLIDAPTLVRHANEWRASQTEAIADALPLAETAVAAAQKPKAFHRAFPEGKECSSTKRPYSKREADAEIKRLTTGRRAARNHRTTYLRAYECPECGRWHLTSKPLRGNDE